MQSLLMVYIVFALAIYLLYIFTKESYETKVDKTKCRKMAHKKLWSTYDWTRRVMNKDGWKCPSGWQNTGCTWEMGNEFEQKQCRRKKSETTSEDKNTKRSDITKKLIAGIHLQEAAIKALGGTPKGSSRFASANVTEDELVKRANELKKQLEELQKNKPGGGGEEKTYDKNALIASIGTIQQEIVNMGGKARKKNTYPDKSVEQLQLVFDTLQRKLDKLVAKKNKSGAQPSASEGQAGAAAAAAPVSSASIESKITDVVKLNLTYSCKDVANHYRNDIEKTEGLVRVTLDAVGNDAFVIATWTGQGGDATGYATKIHVECLTNPTTKSTRGYDIYIWAPGATGKFVHRNEGGFGNWRMQGGKFNENWRSGTDGSIVTINN